MLNKKGDLFVNRLFYFIASQFEVILTFRFRVFYFADIQVCKSDHYVLTDAVHPCQSYRHATEKEKSGESKEGTQRRCKHRCTDMYIRIPGQSNPAEMC